MRLQNVWDLVILTILACPLKRWLDAHLRNMQGRNVDEKNEYSKYHAVFIFRNYAGFGGHLFLLIALNYTERTVMDNAIENTTRLVNQVSYDVDSYISYMSNITTMISENEDVSNYLFAEDLSASERSAAKEKVILQFIRIKEPSGYLQSGHCRE